MVLVETAEDFGMQSSNPTHPELLDWLATEFIDSGWDIRRLQKSIVMSATYRQSSVIREDLKEKDPENRLLTRGVRLRMPAEMVRDNALAASGLSGEARRWAERVSVSGGRRLGRCLQSSIPVGDRGSG